MDWDIDQGTHRPVCVGDLVELQRHGAWAAVQVVQPPDSHTALYTGVVRATTSGLPPTVRPGAYVFFEPRNVIARIRAGDASQPVNRAVTGDARSA